jgi:hypothetical protein
LINAATGLDRDKGMLLSIEILSWVMCVGDAEDEQSLSYGIKSIQDVAMLLS